MTPTQSVAVGVFVGILAWSALGVAAYLGTGTLLRWWDRR